ncbi:MAG: aminotransferase class I/II-fold pyridoxal phosphate-dependent enzyme [Verrucomicrobia bacterium]|nr:aminotransferase class I/II-fold pyridoxal phosphate-dependent enzyme [Verrucomicrobiota bacterium]
MRDLPDPLDQAGRTVVRWRGREFAYFGGCDYLRMSGHPSVLRALQDGAKAGGLNVAASRKTTGNHGLYELLERECARFFGAERAVLLPNGYLTNLAVAQALAGRFTHVLLDARAHASLLDAAPAFSARVAGFPHRNPAGLGHALKRLGRAAKPVVLTDGVFGHDGSVAPLASYLALLPRDGCILVDDAHGAGVVGRRGRGTPELEKVSRERVIQTITFSKAFGVFGGAVLASRDVCAQIVARSRAWTGCTPLPLPVAAAALASLKTLRADDSRRVRLAGITRFVKARLKPAGLEIPDTPASIIAITPTATRHTRRLSQQLVAAGVFPSLIRYPGGPEGGYFRFALSSEHTLEQLAALVRVLQYNGRQAEVH